ncbi:SHOCT domain-containing protein [Streptomyces sp. NPDC002088]|uniref:SHOCT domain-containing protein n=1 Tax=Streptomyces sp. NPDC002088 TaxID=3154665 RepID=UPI00331B9E25
MYWNSDHMNDWGWLAMSLSTVFLWALLIAVGVLLLRALNRSSTDTHTRASRTTPERCRPSGSRAEVDEDEYWHRLAVLRSDSPDRTEYSP